MKVRALVEHRHAGETIEAGKTYELPEKLATRAISEGWVEEAVSPKSEGKKK